ncbi:MAG: D-2-hydroxyacid dehydrogenase [Deltaproteobacteria bacterium]|nr:D-2-hydroxyacid dehydrogenase [Deltaproteobacteria bacterium]
MPSLLTTSRFAADLRAELARRRRAIGRTWDVFEVAPGEHLLEEALGGVDIAFFPGDFTADPLLTRSFFGAAMRAPNLRWMHLPNAGTDAPIFARLLERGVRLTTSSGASAAPIAQSAIGGMLALARGMTQWWDAQRRHAWEPTNLRSPPPDLAGQTMVVVGLGAIGREIARLARAIGLRVVGVRRSARSPEDPVDDVRAPAELTALLPETDWLVLACPLTEETIGWIDRDRLSLLPRGAHLINVARGGIVDQAALIEALRLGKLAGAYLDVFEVEPLPPDSPLWELPNVVVSPHDSSPSAGNVGRQSAIFFRNLERLERGEPLENEVHRTAGSS